MAGGSPLDSSVLVLNRFYMAVRVVDVRRAMTLLYRGCAEVITIEGDMYSNYDFQSWCEISEIHAMDRQPRDEFLRTPTSELLLPRIVRLNLYDKVPKSTVRFNRKNLFARDNYACQYCGQREELTFDHVVPRSKGGLTTWENVVAACSPCNLRKGDKMPASVEMFPAQKPYAPTVNDLHRNGKLFPPNYLHESWLDYLYWDSELEP